MVVLWNAETGDTIRTLRGHTDWVNSVTFSPDSKTLATASYKTAILWNAETGDTIRTIRTGKIWGVDCVAFNPKENVVVTTNSDIVTLWNAETGDILHTWDVRGLRAETMIFNSNGKKIAIKSTHLGDSYIDICQCNVSGSNVSSSYTISLPPNVGTVLNIYWKRNKLYVLTSTSILTYSIK